MQSIFRFVLASLVVVAHLTEGFIYTQHFGLYAVFGFYVLSGYIITFVINEVYRTESKLFWYNRFLRLYPIYWIIAALTIATIYFFPEAAAWKASWDTSDGASARELVSNVLIFPQAFIGGSFRLVPPMWSVAVEIVLYFLLWALLARRKVFAFLFLILSLFYHGESLFTHGGWYERYGPVSAATLPFSLGALIYFYLNKIDSISSAKITYCLTICALLWVLNLVAASFFGQRGSSTFDLFFYGNLAVTVALAATMAHRDYRARAKSWAKLLGDLAYPVFLSHWQIGFLVSALILDGQRRGFSLLLVSLPLVYLFSVGLVFMTDRLIEPMRDRLRPQSKIKDIASKQTNVSPLRGQ